MFRPSKEIYSKMFHVAVKDMSNFFKNFSNRLLQFVKPRFCIICTILRTSRDA